ncbi:alcohol dehydrogenase catalytic domain-containing protein [Mycobacterium sp. E2479]|uniref:alcohol dehydrogenase catalytic domain-containing protein n=1 Tax=Mycobacterium sp. E2479 TaxID=1834134 RepID=UPI0018D4CE7E|nr:alcohol dehydrogenase catalytic domain-containing protein [Mycobacterium sp. E2479]
MIEDLPDPTPRERELVIKVERSGICGTDLHLTDGKGFLQAPPGIVLGHEFAGEVVAVGREVERFKTGDRITSLAAIAACGTCPECRSGDLQWCTGSTKLFPVSGGYAQYAPVAEPQAIGLPHSLSLADAALVEPLAVGWHGYRIAEVKPGASVLVLGAGPIGLGVVFWARCMGARKIVVQARSRRREQQALAMGADAFITTTDALEVAHEALGAAPDVVFEAVGTPGSIERAMQIVQPRGTVVVLGWCGVADSYTPALYLMKEVRLQFSMTYSVADFEHTARALDEGGTGPRSMVTNTIGLDELPSMFEGLRAANHECKVLIDPWR